MKLWMLTVLLIEIECIKQRSFIAFILVNRFHLCNHSNQKKYFALRVNNCYGTTFDLDFDFGSHKYCQKLIPEVRFVRKDGIEQVNLALLLKTLFYRGGHVGF